MKIGAEAHKELFCCDFIDSHNPYEVDELPWPELDAASLTRLRSVPFWQEVFYAERRAGVLVQAFAETIDDPLLREAIDLQGFEEARHAQLIRYMIDRYGIEAQEQPVEALPEDIETAFIDFGYGECVDAFFGFGAYEIARRSGYLPEAMFSVLSPLMHEETRHIVFFVNWMAYREVKHGRGAAPLRGMTSVWFHGRAVGRHLRSIMRGRGAGGRNFSATQADVFPEGFSVRELLKQCLEQNARRMSAFDPRLLRPQLMPALGKAAYALVRMAPARGK